MRRAALAGLSVFGLLLTVMVFCWIGYQEATSCQRVMYRVDMITGKVTMVRLQELDRAHVLEPTPALERMVPRHVLPSAVE
jgi:hypothetical protein